MALNVCDNCKRDFGDAAEGTWFKVEGWIIQRRGQGLKANSVHEKKFLGPVLCPDCGKLREMGVPSGQSSLL